MATVISLREVIEAMEITSEDCISYLDPETGEIITVTEEERHLAEDESLEDVPEWQREMLPKIRAALESDRFLELPAKSWLMLFMEQVLFVHFGVQFYDSAWNKVGISSVKRR